jgi:hypothetical protein
MTSDVAQDDGESDEGREADQKCADKNFRSDVDEIVWILENENLTKTGRAKLEVLLMRGMRHERAAGTPEDEYAVEQYSQYKESN